MGFRVSTLLMSGTLAAASVVCAPTVHGQNPPLVGNDRLNESVFVNIITAQAQNGCPVSTRFQPSTGQPQLDDRLIAAARRHTFDVRDRGINGSIGSDGSTPQDRAREAGFVGKVSETIAINPALSITGIEILQDFWYNPEHPEYRAIMQDCSNTAIGVWSENSLARTVVVAVYGQPGTPA